jgi:hypothetical protein
VVASRGDVLPWRPLQTEGQRRVVEARPAIQHEPRERPEAASDPVQPGLRVRQPQAKPLMHVLVEALEEHLAGFIEPGADLLIQLGLQGGEGGLDFLRRPALLIDAQDRFLEVHARLDAAEHLVGCAEDAAARRKYIGHSTPPERRERTPGYRGGTFFLAARRASGFNGRSSRFRKRAGPRSLQRRSKEAVAGSPDVPAGLATEV